MTYQPPPPGGNPPPPPGGGYGPAPGSPGGQRSGGSSFDPKTINPLDWVVLGAGLLTFIFSFLDYYTGTASFHGLSQSAAESAWHGFFGWFAALLALAGALLVAVHLFAPQVQLPSAARLISLALFAIALLFVIIAAFVTPGTEGSQALAAQVGVHISYGRGIGFWLSLILVVIAVAASLMRFQQTGGQLPGRLANMPNIGRYGPQGGMSGGQQQSSYGTQPPQQGYGAPPPAPPQQGYEQPPQ